MTEINDAYYSRKADAFRNADPAAFARMIAQYRDDILSAQYKDSDKAFTDSLPWVAGQLVRQKGGALLEPGDITDADIEKLETLRTLYGFDYMKDMNLRFTTQQAGSPRLGYAHSFLTYLASKPGDFTDYQAAVITGLVERLAAESKPWSLGISYVMRATDGYNHNDKKNLFHVLVEGPLTPNKKKIADLVAPALAQESYTIYAATSSWDGSRGQKIYQQWYTFRNALHSAVASGLTENVDYALSLGVRQTMPSNSYGSTAFADAVARDDDPAFHAIALRLFENALTLENGPEILRTPSRWNSGSVRPIQTLGRLGSLAFTVAMAQANAGVPEHTAQAFTYASAVTRGDYYAAAAGDLVYHPPVPTVETKTEWQVTETGRIEDPFPYIRQAAFNLDPKTGSYDAYQDIFGKAVAYLVDTGALEASDIPEDSLASQRSLNFIFALRAAAKAEKQRNPDFLAKTAVFTQGFSDEVKKAKTLSRNFTQAYPPSANVPLPQRRQAPAKTAKAKNTL